MKSVVNLADFFFFIGGVAGIAQIVFFCMAISKKNRVRRKKLWALFAISLAVMFLACIIGSIISPPKPEEPTSPDAEQILTAVPAQDEAPESPDEDPAAAPEESEEPEVPEESEPQPEQTEDNVPAPSEDAPSAPAEAPAAEPAPDPTPEPSAPASTNNYVASAESDKYHLPKCRFAKKILPENAIWFATTADAKAAGYSPCGSCHPG